MVAAIEDANGVASMDFDGGTTARATNGDGLRTGPDGIDETKENRENDSRLLAASGEATTTSPITAGGRVRGPSRPVDLDQDVIQIMALCAFRDPNGYLPVRDGRGARPGARARRGVRMRPLYSALPTTRLPSP